MDKFEKGLARRIFCNTCKVETNHVLLATHERHWYQWQDEYSQPIYWETYRFGMWVCQGCDTATLSESFTSMGMEGPDGKIWDTTFYPRRLLRALPKKRFVQLNKKLNDIYSEIIDSFNNGLPMLCAIGCRSLIEGVCAEEGVGGRNLQEKINNLTTLLPANLVESLHGFRFMGNLAAHELTAPDERDLRLAIEVIEDLLNFLYDLDYKARKLLDMG